MESDTLRSAAQTKQKRHPVKRTGTNLPLLQLIFWCYHDDVIKWKHFPCYWPFMRGIHRWPVNSPHKWPVMRRFDVFFDLRLNKRLSYYGTPKRTLMLIFLYQKIIFWYQKSISDIENHFWYQKIIFWYQKIFEFLISENHFLISENHFLISEISDIKDYYQKMSRFSYIRN